MNKISFDDLSNNWYNRTVRLAHIVFNTNQPLEKRLKALPLYYEMLRRTLKLMDYYMEHSKPKPKFPLGGAPIKGHAIVGERGRELIIKKS